MNLDTFTRAYITCALWSSTDETGDPLDDAHDESDLAPEALQQMREDCADFIENQAQDLSASGLDDAQAGHDFWLTRNGHGAGFWDRGIGAVGDRLSDAAKVYGGCDLYMGDDGKIYI